MITLGVLHCIFYYLIFNETEPIFLLSGQLHFHQPVRAGPGVCLDGGTLRGVHAFRQQAGDYFNK